MRIPNFPATFFYAEQLQPKTPQVYCSNTLEIVPRYSTIHHRSYTFDSGRMVSYGDGLTCTRCSSRSRRLTFS